jgi:hypothetical protein
MPQKSVSAKLIFCLFYMSTKETKRGIIPSIVGKFSSKDPDDAGREVNADKPVKTRQRPSSATPLPATKQDDNVPPLSRSSYISEINSLISKEKVVPNKSEWVETAQEEQQDNSKIKRKKRKKVKRRNGNYVVSSQPVRLNHAPSIAGICMNEEKERSFVLVCL